MSSNSLPSTQKPWRLTHCDGMGELFKKCWITTQNTPMDNQTLLWQGGWIWKGQHDLFLLGKIR